MKIRLPKTQKATFLIIGLIVVLAGWWMWVSFEPKPLGDKLEYLGKSDYGCWWICDSQPGSTYYYGTDMNLDEVVGYFKRTRLERPVESQSGLIKSIALVDKDSTLFHIYYKKSDDVQYKHIVEIDAKYYAKAITNM